jgi:hypothetical protein
MNFKKRIKNILILYLNTIYSYFLKTKFIIKESYFISSQLKLTKISKVIWRDYFRFKFIRIL